MTGTTKDMRKKISIWRKSAGTMSSMIGHVDSVQAGKVRGWAFVPAEPDRRVKIDLLVDGRSVAVIAADRYRADLEAKGYGDGSHGFLFVLPDALLDGREHRVEVVDATNRDHRLVARTRFYRLDRGASGGRHISDLLFDPQFYEKQAGFVQQPLDHYRTFGWRHGFNPHPIFDTRFYCSLYGLTGDEDPLTHFETIGQWSSAATHPLFDAAAKTKDGTHPVLNYLARAAPGDPSSFFSDAAYEARRPGVIAAGFLPLVHYLSHGWQEDTRPHSDFDPTLFARLAGLDAGVEPYGYFVKSLLRRVSHREPVAAPKASIIILNFNKSLLTLQCLYFIELFTDLRDVEIIVVDNGSTAEEFAFLCRHTKGAKVVRVGANRGFGEGNNIGAEHARGAYLIFVNNDVFVRDGWLQPLLRAVESDPRVGAVGAKLLFADGSLQEAGALMSACGVVTQRGKHLDPRLPIFNRIEPVDYCSAALLLVRADSFHAVLGFDLCWDPAYFEDADLCFKLRAIDMRTVYAHESEVVHLEHATAGDPQIASSLRDIITVNRLKFVERWTQDESVPSFRKDPDVVRGFRKSQRVPTLSLALYTPYPLRPGGGERYLLTIASLFGRDCHCVLFTPDRYSRIRLLTLARDLDLDLDHVVMETLSEIMRYDRFDVFVCMGNEVLPPVPGMGRLNIYHCQFPFPMAAGHYASSWNNLKSYDGIIVNSTFTAHHYAATADRIGLLAPTIRIVPPPVPQIDRSTAGEKAEPSRILSVGRFTPGGHRKRQDAMIEAFAKLSKDSELAMELHLAGAVGDDAQDRAYFRDLTEAARGLAILFHPNATARHLADLYASATLYWHLTGAGHDPQTQPELFEHFGIAIAEAMSAGVVPLALGEGGPSEIITTGVDGILVKDVHDIATQTQSLLADRARLRRMSLAGRQRARHFAPARFEERFAAAVADFGGHGLPARAEAAQ